MQEPKDRRKVAEWARKSWQLAVEHGISVVLGIVFSWTFFLFMSESTDFFDLLSEPENLREGGRAIGLALAIAAALFVGPVMTTLLRSRMAGIAAVCSQCLLLSVYLGEAGLPGGVMAVAASAVLAAAMCLVIAAPCRRWLPLGGSWERWGESGQAALILLIGLLALRKHGWLLKGSRDLFVWLGGVGPLTFFVPPVWYLLEEWGMSLLLGDPAFVVLWWWLPFGLVAFRWWLGRKGFRVWWPALGAIAVVAAAAWLLLVPTAGGGIQVVRRSCWVAALVKCLLSGPYHTWLDDVFSHEWVWLLLYSSWFVGVVVAVSVRWKPRATAVASG